MKRLIVALSLAVLAACNTYNLTTNTNTNGQPGGSASPSPGPGSGGSCPGAALIASIRVNPFGYDCPSGVTKPNNSSGLLPVGCTAAVTATPKDAAGVDVPASLHGTDIAWSVVSGGIYIEVTSDPNQTFNKNVKGLSAPGEFNLQATVCGKSGAWVGRTIP